MVIKLSLKKILLFCILLVPLSQAEAFVLMLDWYINPNHAPIYVALTDGIFQKHGISVEIQTPSDPADGIKLLVANQADMVLSYEPTVVLLRQKKVSVLPIAALIDQPLDCVVALNKNIQTPADLKNKNIGYSSAATRLVNLRKILQSSSLTLQDVHLINVRYNLTQSLLNGSIDAATGMMRNIEVEKLHSVGHTPVIFYPENFGVPRYSELVFVVRKNEIKNEVFQRFFLALREATILLKKNPEHYWEEFSKQYPEMDDDLHHNIWKNNLALFSDSYTNDFDSKNHRVFSKFIIDYNRKENGF